MGADCVDSRSMNRVLAGVGGASLAAMLIVGCSHSGSGAGSAPVQFPVPTDTTRGQTSDAVAPSGPQSAAASAKPVPPPLVTPDRLRTLVVPPDVSGPIVGSPLGFEKLFNQPAPALDLGSRSSCAVLFGPTVRDYGKEWTAYKGAQQKNAEDNSDHVVGQGAGSYPDTDAARAAFAAAFPPAVSECNSVAVNNPRDTNTQITWRFDVSSVDGASARWSRIQLNGGQPTDWSCAYEARLKSNVVLYASVCEHGDSGAAAAGQLTDRMLIWFPDA
jgi:PknH-like extracellular domain